MPCLIRALCISSGYAHTHWPARRACHLSVSPHITYKYICTGRRPGPRHLSDMNMPCHSINSRPGIRSRRAQLHMPILPQQPGAPGPASDRCACCSGSHRAGSIAQHQHVCFILPSSIYGGTRPGTNSHNLPIYILQLQIHSFIPARRFGSRCYHANRVWHMSLPAYLPFLNNPKGQRSPAHEPRCARNAAWHKQSDFVSQVASVRPTFPRVRWITTHWVSLYQPYLFRAPKVPTGAKCTALPRYAVRGGK